MKYLGIDYGSKRVGTAVSNEEGTIAFPRKTFLNNEKLTFVIAEMAARERVGRVVIGDTRSHGGGGNEVTPRMEKFAEELARATGKPVARAFEAWSSIEASRYSPKGEHDDAAAAAIILQRYLDMKK